eukprot:TRINITY_DN682_c0_g1_i3.p1 TRINITY_DN682_c0_g1~~TRINITY_DN682_c0_g1_i3.p1  ORF type:complete len:302 (+),score=93.04 TRINITY_DN682_c0_g1_i3:55-960(+)
MCIRDRSQSAPVSAPAQTTERDARRGSVLERYKPAAEAPAPQQPAPAPERDVRRGSVLQRYQPATQQQEPAPQQPQQPQPVARGNVLQRYQPAPQQQPQEPTPAAQPERDVRRASVLQRYQPAATQEAAPAPQPSAAPERDPRRGSVLQRYQPAASAEAPAASSSQPPISSSGNAVQRYKEAVRDTSPTPVSEPVVTRARASTIAAPSSAPGKAAPGEKCTVCGKTVYVAEKISADEKIFHKACFRCTHCNGLLKLGNYASLTGKYYCKPHFKQLFALKGNYNEGFGAKKLTHQWAEDHSH